MPSLSRQGEKSTYTCDVSTPDLMSTQGITLEFIAVQSAPPVELLPLAPPISEI